MNTLPARSQNKGRTEQFQRRASWLRTGPFPAGGRRQGGGERGKLGPRDGIPTKLQTGFQSLTKDFLRFWMVDIRQEGRGSSEQTQDAPDRRLTACAETEAGTAEGRRRAAPGRARPSSSWRPELLGRGRHRTQAQPSPRLCGGPEN